MTEINLIEEKSLREKCINRVDILDRVKALFLVPELEIATVKIIADYYEVDIATVQKCYFDHKDELNQDGVKMKSYKEFLIIPKVQLETAKGKTILKLPNEVELQIPNRGIKCFSKRAILRIGMLLRDSDVAKEVRTQLLNVFEHSTSEQKIEDIYNEEKLLLDLAKSYVSKDFDAFAVANQNYIDYQNRHINALKNDNKALAGDILSWEDRSKINKAVRAYATKSGKPYGVAWNILYDELRYKQHIGLSQRGKPPYIQHVKEDEWPAVIQSFSAICENDNISPAGIMEKAKIM